MTTTTNLLLGKYTVETANPERRYAHGIGCDMLSSEFIITGKRGAVYTTYRTAGQKSVQFRAITGKFCALEGNYSLPVALLERHAVTLTDADRVEVK